MGPSLPPIAGGAETTKERIERLVQAGRMPVASVLEAETLWTERLRFGVPLPNGERASIELPDLYHLIVDPRIWRKPERIEWLLRGIFQVRTGDQARRVALSRWQEVDGEHLGHVVLMPDGRVRTMHVTDARDLRKRGRKGEQLWP